VLDKREERSKRCRPGRQLGAGSQHGTKRDTGSATALPSPARDRPRSEPDQALATAPTAEHSRFRCRPAS